MWTLRDVHDELMAAEEVMGAADALYEVSGEHDELTGQMCARARRHWVRARLLLDEILTTYAPRPLSPEEFAEQRKAEEGPPEPLKLPCVGGPAKEGETMLADSTDVRLWLGEREGKHEWRRSRRDAMPDFAPGITVKGYYEPTPEGDKAVWHPVLEAQEGAPVC